MKRQINTLHKNNINTIIWDFDGVILDSMPIRTEGFRKVLENYPQKEVDKLIEYHLNNGGLSRYAKFTYFFSTILGIDSYEDTVIQLADSFKKIMLLLLSQCELLINDSLTFIKKNYKKYNFHIASGSDEIELKTICKTLNIDIYFKSIHGSPTPKNELVSNIINFNNYNTKECILIGDSYNDYEAAQFNSVAFLGYNNEKLMNLHNRYIHSFSSFHI